MSARPRWKDPQNLFENPLFILDPASTIDRVEFSNAIGAERDAKTAARSTVRPVRRRRLLVGGKEYAAFDAHDLLDATAADLGRPGHLYG